MPSNTNQLPKGGKAATTRPRKPNALPFYLAGGALLVIIIGIVLLSNLGRGSSGTASGAQVSGQPKLQVDREKIDFGRVPLDKAITATFKVSNVGDQPLQILGEPVIEAKQGC